MPRFFPSKILYVFLLIALCSFGQSIKAGGKHSLSEGERADSSEAKRPASQAQGSSDILDTPPGDDSYFPEAIGPSPLPADDEERESLERRKQKILGIASTYRRRNLERLGQEGKAAYEALMGELQKCESEISRLTLSRKEIPFGSL